MDGGVRETLGTRHSTPAAWGSDRATPLWPRLHRHRGGGRDRLAWSGQSRPAQVCCYGRFCRGSRAVSVGLLLGIWGVIVGLMLLRRKAW